MTALMRLLPAAVVLLAACTPMRYDRPGAPPEQVAFDQDQCRSLAARDAFFYGPHWFPPAWVSRHPGAYLSWQNRVELDQIEREHDLADFCMRTRGYRLVPDDQPSITWDTPSP